MDDKRGIKLPVFISILIIFIILSIVSVSLIVSMKMYKTTLTENYLDSNYNYATKLTSSTEYQLNYMQNNIIAMATIAGDHTLKEDELHTLYEANRDQFNSIFLTDTEGVVQVISPSSVQYRNSNELLTKGSTLKSIPIKRALSEQKPSISEPYTSSTNQLITIISAPIFDKETNEFLGIVGGAIFLDSENVLKHILATHEYDDDTYVYVVDEGGRIIYHPEVDRIGDRVSENKIVQQAMNKNDGSLTGVNSEGEEFFAGYSYVESTGWGIISQTPTSIVKTSLIDLIKRQVVFLIPFIIIISLIGAVFVAAITRPLSQLAKFSERTLDENFTAELNTETLNIRSPIYEVRQLYYQMIDHIRILNKQAKMDGLTEIANRRLFDLTINAWMKKDVPFTLVLLDIDFFKKVNDKHGHLLGDEVLKHLTKEMKKLPSKDDLCFRYGGEEFGVLLKNQGEAEGFEWAETLRTSFAEDPNPSGDQITISFGVSAYRTSDEHPKTIVNRADAALYHSKQTGRNKTTVFYEAEHGHLL